MTDTEQRESEALQGNAAGKPYTGRMFNGNMVFITGSIEDAKSIESITNTFTGAAALDTFSGMDLANTLAEWNGPDGQAQEGTAIICLDNTAEGRKRSTELLSSIQEIHTKCITWNLCGKYQTPKEAAAADPAQFEKEIQAALKAAEAARIPDDLDAFLDRIQTKSFKPYRTGLAFLDRLLGGGIIQQTLTLLLAAPGTGKTTLCQQIAERIAAAGNPVIFLNLEMSQDQMLAKAISARLAAKGIYMDATKILQGYTWTDSERKAVAAEIDEYRQSVYKQLQYTPAGVPNDLDKVTEIINEAGEAAKAAGKPAPAVILDYLHLLNSKNYEKQDLLQEAVKRLKDYAITYNTFVIAIVAANRESMKKGQLSMTSARDSSALEYTADYFITLNYLDYDQKLYDPQDDNDFAKLQTENPRRMILRLPKSRFGQPGRTEKILFYPAVNSFAPQGGIEAIQDIEQIDFTTQAKPRKRL